MRVKRLPYSFVCALFNGLTKKSQFILRHKIYFPSSITLSNAKPCLKKIL